MFKEKVDFQAAGNLLTVLLLMLLVFHLSVLGELIPDKIVWGGRSRDADDFIFFEGLALGITGFFLIVTRLRIGNMHARWIAIFTRTIMWVMFVFFAIHTVTNLLGGSVFEKAVFAPASLFMALLAFRLAAKRSEEQTSGGLD